MLIYYQDLVDNLFPINIAILNYSKSFLYELIAG